MRTESSHGSRRRERVAPNLYRRRTADGDRFDVAFRDTDGRMRFRVLEARSQREAEREARRLLAQRDSGERVATAPLSFAAFVEAEFLPGIDALADAGRRSRQGVNLDRTHLRLYLLPALGELTLGRSLGPTSPRCCATSAAGTYRSRRAITR